MLENEVRSSAIFFFLVLFIICYSILYQTTEFELIGIKYLLLQRKLNVRDDSIWNENEILYLVQHRFGTSAVYDAIILNIDKDIIQLEAEKTTLDNRLNLLLAIPAPIAGKTHPFL